MNAQAHAFSNAQTFMVVYVWNNQEAVWLLGRKTKTLVCMLRKQLYDSVAVMIHDLFSPATSTAKGDDAGMRVQHEFRDVKKVCFFSLVLIYKNSIFCLTNFK